MGPFLGFCMKNYSNDKGLTRNPFLPVKKNRDKTVPNSLNRSVTGWERKQNRSGNKSAWGWTTAQVHLHNPTKESQHLRHWKAWPHPGLQIKVSCRIFVSSKSTQNCTTLKFQPALAFIMDWSKTIKQVLGNFFQHVQENNLLVHDFFLFEGYSLNVLFKSKYLNK